MTGLLLVSHDAVGERMAGPGIRAWEMAHALARAGHDVVLAAPGPISGPAETRQPAAGPITDPVELRQPAAGPTTDPVELRQPAAGSVSLIGYTTSGESLRAAADSVDVVLVQSLVLANHPFLGALAKPVVCDLYDPFILENLPARAAMPPTRREQRDRGDRAALNALLTRGDFFICASETQRDFWSGALAVAGRLNALWYQRDPTLRTLIDVVPFGIPSDPPRHAAPALKGVVPGIAPNDVVALWGGGIWNWLDPLTLLQAAEEVSARHPLRVVFLGTQSPSPHAAASDMAVAARAHSDRRGLTNRVAFFLDGWVPYHERGAYLLEADLAVSCHRPLVEARYAFRTRLLDCIWAGLPMVVTEGDTLAEAVVKHDLGQAVPAEDAAALAAALESVLNRLMSAGRQSYGPAFAAVRPDYVWDTAVEPLARFLTRARTAPDLVLTTAAEPTPFSELPRLAARIWREEGGLALAEEAARYLRWRRRS